MKKKNELLIRFLSGIVAVSIAIPAIVLSPYGIWLFGVIVSLVSFWEFMRGMRVTKGRYLWPALSIGMLFWLLELVEIYTDNEWKALPIAYQTIVILIIPILGIIGLFNREENRPVESLGTIALGYLYVVYPMYLLYVMSFPDNTIGSYNFWIPLGSLWLTWTLDVMAYFFGKYLGKHPLFPRISPKKTWEGAIGGTVFCLGMALLMDYFIPQEFSWLVISIITSIFSQLGDLVESMFKRSVQLKDSGKIIPGHGGMLDRFDGMFVSVPVIFLYLSWL